MCVCVCVRLRRRAEAAEKDRDEALAHAASLARWSQEAGDVFMVSSTPSHAHCSVRCCSCVGSMFQTDVRADAVKR